MTTEDAESPLPVSEEESADRNESGTASPVSSDGARNESTSVVNGREETNEEQESTAETPDTTNYPASVFSESSKPDPPPSVDYRVREEVEQDEDAFAEDGEDEEVPSGEQDENKANEDVSGNDDDKPHLDYINVPSQEELAVQALTRLSGVSASPLHSIASETKEELVIPELPSNENGMVEERSEPQTPPVDTTKPDELVMKNEETPVNMPRVYDAPAEQSQALPEPPSIISQTQASADPHDPDAIPLLPRVDEQGLPSRDRVPRTTYIQQPPLQLSSFHQSSFGYAPVPAPAMTMGRGGRRKIHLRLLEDVRTPQPSREGTILGHIRRRSSRMMFGGSTSQLPEHEVVEFTSTDRGSITVSWFEGTSSLELQEHVRKSVVRKLKLPKNIELTDVRVLDETQEEIVLSPYIPDGSNFLLRFSIRDTSNDGTTTPGSQYSSYSVSRPPDSPSAAPSPHPSSRSIAGLNANQLALLRNQLNALSIPSEKPFGQLANGNGKRRSPTTFDATVHHDNSSKQVETRAATTGSPEKTNDADEDAHEDSHEDHHEDADSKALTDSDDDDEMMLHSEDPIEARLRQIVDLLMTDRQKKNRRSISGSSKRTEKRQVIFVLANYFVLFLSLVAISAEIQARAPGWAKSMETHLKNVQDCAVDQEALFQCVSNGDVAGLIASVILWFSRSVATRRIFLFGFETTNKLWTVVYESFVTALCWGVSYLFIRRGMNPDTRHRFLQKYWKDAVYGSLAGFNAAFMKQILKNLIPKEVVEDALRERQLKILSWLPSFH